MNAKNKKIEKLDIFKSPIIGINLIEASAGTGKTFTIVLLYLRLILGLGNCNQNNIKNFKIHEILVVTFTNSSKNELYLRIKKSIENLYLACIEKIKKDSYSEILLKEITNINKAISILKKAQNTINHASIYTIHEFCKKMLNLYTFNFNVNFEEKIIDNEDNIYLQATEDFWRCYFYNLPENIIKIILKIFREPIFLLKEIKPLLNIESITFHPKFIKNETLITYHKKIIKEINNFKKIWLKNNQNLLEKIKNLNINKRKYSFINISRWIKNISKWAESITEDYDIPKTLKYFSEKKIKKNTIDYISEKNIIFLESEKILKKNFSLKNIIIFHAQKHVRKFVLKEKKKQSLLGFNDLLKILLKSIKKEKYLRKLIRTAYPVAFIDEFQDTDIYQYQIFNYIYREKKNIILFLIGDPKQAIYNFRGADIFSYLYAKSKIKNHYYLDTNWRSSKNMCDSINLLFSQHKNPFLFKKITFIPVLSCSQNSKMNFTINGIPQAELQFFLQEKKEVKIEDYHNWISTQCANQISYWLNSAKKGKAIINIKQGKKILQENDIAILVRNQKEADIIQKSLNKMNISSIYSSCKKNIFKTFEAQELLWILQSILHPNNENLLKKSISTHIFQNLQSTKKSQEEISYFFIEKLYEYSEIWKKLGILYMTKSIIWEYQENFNPDTNILEHEKNIQYLNISEILEEKSQNFFKKSSLLRWFEKKISQKKTYISNQKHQDLYPSKSIQIVTIHKSKGLEYPIVWIPFSVDFHQSKSLIYHNEKNFKTIFDTKNINNLNISDKERLSEDIRFLYVALTRSIVHCSIGIACLIKKTIKRTNDNSHIHKSALGYIIQNGLPMNYQKLLENLNKFNENNFIKVQKKIKGIKLYDNKKIIYLISKQNLLKQEIQNNWKLTSFTQLNKENSSFLNVRNETLIEKIKINQHLTIHNFPKGKKTGLLIHFMLRNLNSVNQKNENWFSEILEKYNFSKKWTKLLISWIHNIINTPLIKNTNFVLSKLKKQEYIKEFEFFMPIKNVLYSSKLNEIIQRYDSISNVSPKIFFNPVTGILKGFIDLVFFWKKKYYIVDYKSNWLGKNNNSYVSENIKKEIIKNRYDLQYQIYTLAVHKYLKQKVKKYSYQNHFGGVFYIFLRAIEEKKNNNGVFHTLPDYSLIKQLIFYF